MAMAVRPASMFIAAPAGIMLSLIHIYYTGRLCVIGSQLKEDGLKTLFGL